jgi:RNA polymerase sigma-70 factor (ECF subfamily)
MIINENEIFLVSQVKLFNSHKAFEKIVKKYQSSVRRLFLNLTMGDKDLSDDLAQETFIKIYLKIDTFKADSKFSTWIYRIAYNIFLDHYKSNQKQFVRTLPENDINFSYSQQSELENDTNYILNLLEGAERETIILSYIEEISHKEIAIILNMPIGTVKTHIKRGREKLVDILKSKAYEKER